MYDSISSLTNDSKPLCFTLDCFNKTSYVIAQKVSSASSTAVNGGYGKLKEEDTLQRKATERKSVQ